MRLSKVVVITCLAGCVEQAGGGGGGRGGGGGLFDECSEAADTCSGERVCYAGDCVAAFPRVYEIRDVEVSVPTTNPNGGTWDVGGGAPDMFLSINGTKVTDAVQDQFSATFPGPFDVSLIAGDGLYLEIKDEDLTVDDPVFACRADPITASILRGRRLRCAAQGLTLDATIDPK